MAPCAGGARRGRSHRCGAGETSASSRLIAGDVCGDRLGERFEAGSQRDYRANPEIRRPQIPRQTRSRFPGAPASLLQRHRLRSSAVNHLTKTRRAVTRWHSTTVFALIGLAFLLPFATVTVGGCGPTTTTTTFSGAQLVTWSVPHNAGTSTTASAAATAALIAAVLGFILTAFRRRQGAGLVRRRRPQRDAAARSGCLLRRGQRPLPFGLRADPAPLSVGISSPPRPRDKAGASECVPAAALRGSCAL